MQTQEGYLDFRGYKTYYVVYGELANSRPPLVVLHGGPGYPHYYLENLANLSENGQAVIFYDQLGCGRSDRPDDPKLWTIEFFVDELHMLREALGLSRVCLLGHSWGGTLALEYIFKQPENVERLILSSPLLDAKIWAAEAKRLIDELPAWAAEIMREHQAAGSVDSYEYQQAYAEFKKRHICRAEPYPRVMVTSDDAAGGQVYNVMWGPDETQITGRLQNWTSLDRIGGVDMPVLFITGKYDEVTPKQVEAARKLLPAADWALLEASSHTGNLEEPDNYLAAVREFLNAGR